MVQLKSLMHGIYIMKSSSLRNNRHKHNVADRGFGPGNPRSQAGCTEALVQKNHHKCSAQHFPISRTYPTNLGVVAGILRRWDHLEYLSDLFDIVIFRDLRGRIAWQLYVAVVV